MAPPSTPSSLRSKFDVTVTPPPSARRSTPAAFAALIAKILHQATPTFELHTIQTTLTTFFVEEHISNEDGLGEVTHDNNLPSRDAVEDSSIWKVSLVRSAFLTICKCAASHYVNDTTTYAHCKHVTLVTHTPPPATTGTSTSTTSVKYSVKNVNKIQISKFSGEYGTYKDWTDSVRVAFGQQGQQDLLDDEELCARHPDASFAAKCVLAQALLDGTASYITNNNMEETNCAKFYKLVKQKCDFQQDRDSHEFDHWIKLLDLRLEDRQEYSTFLNQFETLTSDLKKRESVAVTDDKLMRAIIIRSLQCPDLETFTLDMVKKSSVNAEEIATALRLEAVAFKSKDHLLNNGSTGAASANKQLKIRRGTTGGSYQPTKKTVVPMFPDGLRSVVSTEVWDTLCLWRSLHNKASLSNGEKDRLKSLSFVTSTSSGRDSRRGNTDRRTTSRSKRKPSRSPSRDRASNRSSGKRRTKYGSGRSSKSNRYSDDRKRHSRRAGRHYSDSSYDSSASSNSSDGSSGSYHRSHRRTSRRTNHRHDQPSRSSDHRDSDRDRYTSTSARDNERNSSHQAGASSTSSRSVLFGGGSRK